MPEEPGLHENLQFSPVPPERQRELLSPEMQQQMTEKWKGHGDFAWWVVSSLAQNPSLTTESMHRILEIVKGDPIKTTNIIEDLAGNHSPDFKEWIPTILAVDPDAAIIPMMSFHKELPFEVVEPFLNTKNKTMAYQVWGHPSVPSSILAEKAATTNEQHILHGIADNPNTPYATLVELSKNSDYYVSSAAKWRLERASENPESMESLEDVERRQKEVSRRLTQTDESPATTEPKPEENKPTE
jgi:hypothetical protein